MPSGRLRVLLWTGLALYILAYLLVARAAGPDYGELTRDIFYAVMGVFAISSFTAAAALTKGLNRVCWLLLTGAGIFWAFGDISMMLCETSGIFGPTRVLCYPDLFYFVAYGCLTYIVVAVAMIVNEESEGKAWAKYYPVSLLASVVAVSILFSVFFPGGIAGLGSTGAYVTVGNIVNYIYPAWDIGLVAGLMVILFGRSVTYRRAWHELLIFGMSMFTIADLSYSLFKPAGIYDPANIQSQVIIAVWLLSYGTLAMAAVYRITELERARKLRG